MRRIIEEERRLHAAHLAYGHVCYTGHLNAAQMATFAVDEVQLKAEHVPVVPPRKRGRCTKPDGKRRVSVTWRIQPPGFRLLFAAETRKAHYRAKQRECTQFLFNLHFSHDLIRKIWVDIGEHGREIARYEIRE